MRPSVLIVVRQLVVEIAGICIRRIQTEGRIQRGDFREFDDQLGTRPADVRTIVLLARLDECTVRDLNIHRSPVIVLSASEVDHSGLAVNLDLRI